MQTFSEWLLQKQKTFLAEMPWLNTISNKDGWSDRAIKDLWALAENSSKKIGTLSGEDIYKASLGSSFCYIFLLKQGVPVFVVSLEKRLDLLGWQEDIVAKTASYNTVENLYKWLTKNGFRSIISSGSHSEGMKKVWIKLLTKYKWDAFDDDTGQKVDVQDITSMWSTNMVFRLRM